MEPLVLAKGLLAFLAGMACALALRRHQPVRQYIGGYRCAVCHKAGATEGELLGLDDVLRQSH